MRALISSTEAPAITRTVAELRQIVRGWRQAGQTIAMVPTMGAVHEGHLSLVREGFKRADRVVATIFVNPTQFAPNEDLANYPRREQQDATLFGSAGTDLIFAPAPQEVYPPGFATRIEPQGPALGLEADFRPHFFGGVATVVAKLLLSCLPDYAMFGEKDYQQLLVVRRVVADLTIPTEIVGAPTIREPDGLALSSRNAYLSPQERAAAPAVYAVLNEAARRIRAGHPIQATLDDGARDLTKAGFREIDYLALRDAATLSPLEQQIQAPMRLLVAAWLGKTRLIDNIPL